MADFPLIKAAIDGDLELMRTLLQEGRDANEEDEHGRTALLCAAAKGHLEMIHLLIDHGYHINYQNKYGYTALHFASAKNEHSFLAPIFIEKGADLNIKDRDGFTPLTTAAFWGHPSIVSLLLRSGADASLFTNRGESALDVARWSNKSDCVAILENYEHFHRYRKVWLSFSTSLSSYQDNQNQNQESKQSQSYIQSPTLMRMMDSSDLVRYVTEYM